MPTATNPTTGEKVAWINGEWTPVERTATNKSTGERMALVGGQWQPLDYSDVGGTDFSFKEMASNIPSSAGKYAKDIYSAARHPVETGKAVGSLLGDAVSGRYAQEIARVATGQDPSQGISGAVHSGIKGRYGTSQDAVNTIEQDPIGFLADISGIGAFSAFKPARALEPVRAATKPARAAAKKLVPKDKPADLYQKSAKFSTSPTVLSKGKRDQIIQTALDEGAMPTPKGLEKIQGRIGVLNQQIDDLITQSTKAGSEIPTQAVLAPLKQLRAKKGGFKIESSQDLKFIDDFENQFKATFGNKATVTPKELQRFKVDAYDKISWDARRMAGTPIKEDTYKAVARGAKEAIAEEIPEASKINKVLSDLYSLEPHLERSARRVGNRNPVGLTTPINIGAGGYAGSVAGTPEIGFMAGAAAAVMNNPKMQARLAIALNKLKKGDIGWIEANKGATEVRLALDMAGRLTDQQTNQ